MTGYIIDPNRRARIDAVLAEIADDSERDLDVAREECLKYNRACAETTRLNDLLKLRTDERDDARRDATRLQGENSDLREALAAMTNERDNAMDAAGIDPEDDQPVGPTFAVSADQWAKVYLAASKAPVTYSPLYDDARMPDAAEARVGRLNDRLAQKYAERDNAKAYARSLDVRTTEFLDHIEVLEGERRQHGAQLAARLALAAKSETDADKKPAPAAKEFPAGALRPARGDQRRLGG